MRTLNVLPLVFLAALEGSTTRSAAAPPGPRAPVADPERGVDVADDAQLREALSAAKPGTSIRIGPGRYRGGLTVRGLRGEPDRPIVVTAADPDHPPVLEGGATGWHLSDPEYIELRGLVVEKSRGNGINIDDGGSYDSPAHHVVLRNLVIRDIGPGGNHDGIKLSGLDQFRIEGCTLERWGSEGSGIDMVGCHEGVVSGCTFRHGDDVGGNAVQAKGGTRDITIMQCRFEHAGSRAVNIGGSTGLPYFRPAPRGYEAKDITVEDCTFVGSQAPVAFVGADGAVVRHNTIYRPTRFALRILQETTGPDFVPCRNGSFTDNLIAFRSGEMVMPVNIGPHTAPETFRLARNAWYCLDDPARSQPALPVAETGGVYGQDPGFVDAERGDLRLRPGGPVKSAGARRSERGTR